ncbi:hypothetical protein D9M69_301830 [compost metagenome]
MRNDATQLVELVLSLVGNDAVGTIIDRDGATLILVAAITTGHGLEQLGNIGGLGVVHLDQLTTQRRKFGDLLLRLELLPLARGNFVGRSHQQDIADLALVQTFGLEHQIQGLIPRHVLQAQGDVALHGITGHQVEVSEVGDQLQDRTHINVLEIQRELFAVVSKALSLALFDILLVQRLDADGQLIVGLIGQVIVITSWLDHDTGLVRHTGRTDKLHRGRKVLDVQTHAKTLRQLRLGEVQADLAALLLDVRANRRIGELDHHIALTLFAALEIDIADAAAGSGIYGRRRHWRRRDDWSGSGTCRIAHYHEQVVAFGPGTVRSQAGQVDDQPSAILGLNHRDTARIAHTQVTILGAQLVFHPGKIKRNTGGLVDRIAARGCHWLVECQPQLHLVSRQRCNVQCLQVRRQQHRRKKRRHKGNAEARKRVVHSRIPLCRPIVVIHIPTLALRALFDREASRPLQPTAFTIGNNFDDVHLGFVDRDDAAIIAS